MRLAKFTAAACIVLALGGCDINTGPAKPAQTSCNCTTPPAPPPPAPSYAPPAPHRHWHRRYAYRGPHGYAWRREYAELSVETYDYRSSSSVREVGGGAYYGHAEDRAGGWVDGYGHAQGGAVVGEPVHDTPAARARADVWHGYDADCPDDPARRH